MENEKDKLHRLYERLAYLQLELNKPKPLENVRENWEGREHLRPESRLLDELLKVAQEIRKIESN